MRRSHLAVFVAAVAFARTSSAAFGDSGGYSVDLPGLGQASISKEAAECGGARGSSGLAGQLRASRDLPLPHYVSVVPDTVASRSFLSGIRDQFNPSASASQDVVTRSMTVYKAQGEMLLNAQAFRDQQKFALVTVDGHFACHGLLPGAYTVFATIYQNEVPRAPYDKFGLKQMTVVRFFADRVQIPKRPVGVVVRADSFSMIGTSPPGM